MNIGHQHIMLETDAINVWKSILENVEDHSYSNNILRDIFLYSSWFASFECRHIPRFCNRAVGAMANYAKDSVLESWVDNPSMFLCHILY